MSEFVAGRDIFPEKVFLDLHGFILDNYSKTPEELVQALMAMDALSAVLHKQMEIPVVQIIVEDEE